MNDCHGHISLKYREMYKACICNKTKLVIGQACMWGWTMHASVIKQN